MFELGVAYGILKEEMAGLPEAMRHGICKCCSQTPCVPMLPAQHKAGCLPNGEVLWFLQLAGRYFGSTLPLGKVDALVSSVA